MPEDINKKTSNIKLFDVIKSIRDERLFYVFVAGFVVLIAILVLANNFSKRMSATIPTSGGVYKELISDDVLSITPILASNASEKAISKLVFAPLLANNIDNTKELVLASAVSESSDGLEINVTISPEAKFANGDKVTADDIIYTYDLYSQFGADDNIRNIISAVEVIKVSDSSIIIKRKSNNNLIYQMLNIGIIKKSQFVNLSESEIARDNINYEGVGAGPYKVKSFKVTDLGKISEIKLFENNNFYKLDKVRPYIREIEFTYMENKADIVKMLNTSGNEYSYYSSDKSISKQVSASNTNITSYEIPRTYALYINQSKSTLLNQKDFRAKLANSINREALIQGILGGSAVPAYNPLPFDHTTLITSEASPSNTSSTTASSTIILSTLNSEELLKISQGIKDQLAIANINVEIKSYDKDELIGKVIATRDFEMLLFATEISETSMLYPLWHSSFRKPPGSNISGYLSTSLDKNLEGIIATTSPEEINRLYSEVKNEINSEYAWIPLYTTTITGYTPKQLIINNKQNYIQGLESHLQTINLAHISTEQVWRSSSSSYPSASSRIAKLIYNFIH